MPTVPLSGGASAEIRLGEDMSRREEIGHRKWLAKESSSLEDGDVERGAELEDRLKNRLVHALLESWTIATADGNALPITMDAVLDLRAADFRALYRYAKPAVDLIFDRSDVPKSASSSATPDTPG